MLYTLLILLLIWMELTGGFFAYSHMRALRGRGVTFPWYITYPAYVFLVQFALLDLVFNATWGSFIFREFPREMFFTGRVKRHVKDRRTGSHRYETARRWKRIINNIEPDHI